MRQQIEIVREWQRNVTKLSMAIVLGLGGAMPILLTQTAHAASKIIYVDNATKSHCLSTGPGTAVSPYCTIQEGVNAASSGNEVEVLNGTYSEQVTIGSTKSGITLAGEGNKTILKVPSTVTDGGSILEISGATGVTVQDITVSGPFNAAGCNDNEYGINVNQAASVSFQNVTVTGIKDANNSLLGCQQGVAIEVGDSSVPTTGTATILNSTVNNYQKGGITVDGTGSSASIKNNSITGIGPTPAIAQNGIQISDGATATVSDNLVKANIYSPQTYASTAILLYSPGTVNLNNNVTSTSDVDIYAYGVKNSTFTDNVANNATFNGIYLDSTSTGNKLTDNAAKGTTGNGNYDMEDDSTGSGTLGTANTWHDNGCKTSSPAKLCEQ